MATSDRFNKAYWRDSTDAIPSLPARDELAGYHLMEEGRLVAALTELAIYSEDERRRTGELARQLVHAVRAGGERQGGIDAFMREYRLSTEEGVILMCLAEALLRIPDADTADQLIAEKIGGGKWDTHLGRSDSLFVNASTFGLMLTGSLVRLKSAKGASPATLAKRLVASSGEPIVRQALKQAMRILGDQFVVGRTIKEAISRAASLERRGYRFSYDMLGEGARTEADASRYLKRYLGAIEAVGQAAGPFSLPHPDALMERPGLSVKLSALHPRFEAAKSAELTAELAPRLVELATAARAAGLPLTIDAEEQERLGITLEMFQAAFLDPSLAGWSGLGLAVQAYGKRAIPTLRWLRRMGEHTGKRIPVRLVKGAYWDSEVKWAQERGLDDYPVFTQKVHTDISYLAAVRFVLADRQVFYPQFATHNAHTVAAAHIAAGAAPCEFQRLHGMGDALYDEVVGEGKLGRACRIYAPVGGHEDLLAYLVRRLLENGANTSFVNRIAEEATPVEDIIRDPVEAFERWREAEPGAKAASVPLPGEIFAPARRNSRGLALTEPHVRAELETGVGAALAQSLEAGAIVNGKRLVGGDDAVIVVSPHDRRVRVGRVKPTAPEAVEEALAAATRGLHAWDRQGGEARARVLDRASDLFEAQRARLVAVMVREAGKTLDNALGDVREAVDFLRYYASEARRNFAGPTRLPGPTGERNVIEFRARGPFACIAPWNFPLAIFIGQVSAALAAGNTVLAKPAGQTPLTAFLATEILLQAGVPPDALHLLPGGADVGARICRDLRIKGVAFTGSTNTAWAIQRSLTDRGGPIVPFIAETGGINAMIADSSALPEQVVRDAIRSAFDSAGQRCSAARVLFLQEEIADEVIAMLAGAVATLRIGDPLDYATDIGPVIDKAAQDRLEAHKARMHREGRRIVDLPLPVATRFGTYVSPAVYEIERLDQLREETFGPILHVIRYRQGGLAGVVEAINATGYGLTLGLHSRIAAVADFVSEHARVGNLYVNRNQIGAVVGVQPFGGEGLSGTGPKAGGPGYLARYATERVRASDITVTGGNADLLGLASTGI